ncbi:DUF4435 domain-containing protein [Mesorhizobium sp. B2-7-1]|uniref:DUF4435 domain-containing protein n=1 Tax=Mesorhizobium sp. B2-7-1 TaxID=2589909 RepID=UPI00112C901A|nr:DUF4435 domain-containing protein [Mesorhizobium sp. B2-7-1]TPJ52009.1 DUF4435 domain-containing protein [Mesorhizobium sp. B2-7-1]
MGAGSDEIVRRTKSARESPAVLKLQLIQARGRCGELPILVVEGLDDKSIYSQWLRRIKASLRYEFFVCNGKRQVLGLCDLVRRDLSDLSKSIYFFIDRDFDDHSGFGPGPEIFMTDRYSVENYLVDDTVLDDILRVELHCNAYPALREKIIALFNGVYAQFIDETAEINFRLYLSKVIPISRKGDFPQRINQLAVVALDGVGAQVRDSEDVIALTREPTGEERAGSRAAFDGLEPRSRYRGKFALLFFHRWLDLLADDYASKRTLHFGEIEERARARRNEIMPLSLAARSPMPTGLDDFVTRIS